MKKKIVFFIISSFVVNFCSLCSRKKYDCNVQQIAKTMRSYVINDYFEALEKYIKDNKKKCKNNEVFIAALERLFKEDEEFEDYFFHVDIKGETIIHKLAKKKCVNMLEIVGSKEILQFCIKNKVNPYEVRSKEFELPFSIVRDLKTLQVLQYGDKSMFSLLQKHKKKDEDEENCFLRREEMSKKYLPVLKRKIFSPNTQKKEKEIMNTMQNYIVCNKFKKLEKKLKNKRKKYKDKNIFLRALVYLLENNGDVQKQFFDLDENGETIVHKFVRQGCFSMLQIIGDGPILELYIDHNVNPYEIRNKHFEIPFSLVSNLKMLKALQYGDKNMSYILQQPSKDEILDKLKKIEENMDDNFNSIFIKSDVPSVNKRFLSRRHAISN